MVATFGFPFLIASTVGGSIAAIHAGVAPALVVVVAIAGAYAWLAVLERLVPYRTAWGRSHGDFGTDSAWFVANSLLNRVLEPPLLAVAAVAGGLIGARFGAPVWPQAWPLTAQLALALVLAELFEYWIHRLMHETQTLWRFHSIHHSAPRLYWLNAVRFHPVDYTLVGIGKLLPLVALGAGVEVLALVNVFSAVHGAYQHANVPVRIGPLNWVFSMAELHRWHHSRRIEEANHNYGGNLILWDIIFGTRYLPSDREPPEDTGLQGLAAFPMRFFGQLAAPFRWSLLTASEPRSPTRGRC